MSTSTADLIATADLILAHGYDATELACDCGFSCLRPNHAIYVAVLLRDGAAQ